MDPKVDIKGLGSLCVLKWEEDNVAVGGDACGEGEDLFKKVRDDISVVGVKWPKCEDDIVKSVGCDANWSSVFSRAASASSKLLLIACQKQ